MEKTLGMRIKECRMKMGMTQDELAEALLTKKSTISVFIVYLKYQLLQRAIPKVA